MAETEAPVAPSDVTESNSAVRTPQSPRPGLATDDLRVRAPEAPKTPQSAHTQSDSDGADAAETTGRLAPLLEWLADRDFRLPRIATEARPSLLAYVDHRQKVIDKKYSGWRWWGHSAYLRTLGLGLVSLFYLLAWAYEEPWRATRFTVTVLTVGQLLHALGGAWIPAFITWQFWPPFCWIFP